MTDSTHPGYLTVTSAGHAIAEGVVTIELPGLIAIRIDTRTRTIAVDGISGEACRAEPLLPEWFIHDLRGSTYGDFHQLRLPEDCSDRECVGSGAHDPVYRRTSAWDDARRTSDDPNLDCAEHGFIYRTGSVGCPECLFPATNTGRTAL